jgi:plasmid stabilization system protein ParE
MAYRVELTERAARDLGRLFRMINAENSPQARAWVNGLEELILSLDENPTSGPVIPDTPACATCSMDVGETSTRIIYALDHRAGVVTVIHIRYGARAAFTADENA